MTRSVSAGGPGVYTGQGFSIPDNNPLGAQSSVHTPAFDVVGAMSVYVYFPFTAATGGHTWCGDLVAQLIFTPDTGGPARSQYLFNRIGATSEFSRGDSSLMLGLLYFGDEYGENIWQAAAFSGPTQPIAQGGYHPSSRGADFQYQFVSFAQAYGNSVPAGTWTLNISDHAAGNTGQLLEWRLAPFIPTPATTTLLTTLALGTLRRRR
jgi:hypothetical protein